MHDFIIIRLSTNKPSDDWYIWRFSNDLTYGMTIALDDFIKLAAACGEQ